MVTKNIMHVLKYKFDDTRGNARATARQHKLALSN